MEDKDKDKDKDINNTLSSIGKDLKLHLNTISELTNKIQDLSKITYSSFETFSAIKKVAQPLSQINNIGNYIKIAQIPNLYLPCMNYLAGKLGTFQYKLKQTYNDIDEICSILAKYNYLLPLSLPFSIYSDLLEYLNNIKKSSNKEKEIDKLLLKLFSHKKWEMASDIVDNLHKNTKINPKRIVILKDCIKVLKHNSRKTAANTILPVLIAQIDGIWVDILGSKDKDKLKNTIKKIKNDKYANPARELLVDILFQYTKTAIPVKSDFCRNKILHGEEVEYGSIHNVIRAFLIIEFLDSVKTDDEVN